MVQQSVNFCVRENEEKNHYIVRTTSMDDYTNARGYSSAKPHNAIFFSTARLCEMEKKSV